MLRYMSNAISIFCLAIAIAFAFEGTVSVEFEVAMICVGTFFHMLSSACITSRFEKLENRITELENER